eukprot:Em0014g800a
MEMVLYLYKIPDEYKTRSRLEVLQYLQRHGVFGAHSSDKMKKFLEEINRQDLYCFVDDYKRKSSCDFQSTGPFTPGTLSSDILPSDVSPPLSSNSPSVMATRSASEPGIASVQEVAIERRISSTQGVTGITLERHVSSTQGVTGLQGIPVERHVSSTQGVTGLQGIPVERHVSSTQGVTGFQGVFIEPQVSPSLQRFSSTEWDTFSDQDDSSDLEGSILRPDVVRHLNSGASPESNGAQFPATLRGLCHQGSLNFTNKLRGICSRFLKGPSLSWSVDLNAIHRACLQQRGKPLSHRAITIYIESTRTQVKFLPQLFPCGLDADVGKAVTLEFTIQLPRKYLRSVYFAETSLEVSAYLSNDPDKASLFSERRSCKLGERKVTFYGIIAHSALRDVLSQHLVIEAVVALTLQTTCVDDGDYVIVSH